MAVCYVGPVITVVLDDDPTGTQSITDVSVVLDWSDPDVWNAVEPGDRGVHVLTNSRAHVGDEAGVIVADAAAAARQRFPEARQILRGDSTLRAHLWEEYEALRSVIAPDHPNVPLLLVPAFPAAGRVTIGATHLLERDGRRVPLDQTEYARDGALAYTSADLRVWADERSGGRLAAADGVAVPLEQLRTPSGHAAVAAAIVSAAAGGRPAVVVPDAETDADLDTIARGLEAAEAAGARVIVRSAPAFAAVLTGSQATTMVPAPSGDGGVLVVCGSFVAGTTAQLEQLARVHPQAGVAAHVAALAGESWEDEAERLAAAAAALIERDGLAVVATERRRDPGLVVPTLNAGLRSHWPRSPAACTAGWWSPRAESPRP